MCLKEFLDGVRVPFVDIQSLLYVSRFVQQLHGGVQATDVFDLKVREFIRPIALDKGLDLRIGSEFTGAHFQDSLGVSAIARGVQVSLAALLALWSEKRIFYSIFYSNDVSFRNRPGGTTGRH